MYTSFPFGLSLCAMGNNVNTDNRLIPFFFSDFSLNVNMFTLVHYRPSLSPDFDRFTLTIFLNQ